MPHPPQDIYRTTCVFIDMQMNVKTFTTFFRNFCVLTQVRKYFCSGVLVEHNVNSNESDKMNLWKCIHFALSDKAHVIYDAAIDS